MRRPCALLVSGGLALLATILVACAGPGSSPGPAARPDLTPFVGVWSRHGAGLTISPDGSFSLEWRTYRTCGQDPPPCDQFVNNLIVSGGRAVGTLRAIGSRTAVGQVTATNDPAFAPDGSFLADITDYQLLTLRFPSAALTLCGKSFGTAAPTAVVQTHPCGG